MRDMVWEMFGSNTFCEVRLASGERIVVIVKRDLPPFVGVWSAEASTQVVDLRGWFNARFTRSLPAGFTQVWGLGADTLRAPSDWNVVVNCIFNPRGLPSSVLSLAAVMFTGCADLASVAELLTSREAAAARVLGYAIVRTPRSSG